MGAFVHRRLDAQVPAYCAQLDIGGVYFCLSTNISGKWLRKLGFNLSVQHLLLRLLFKFSKTGADDLSWTMPLRYNRLRLSLPPRDVHGVVTGTKRQFLICWAWSHTLFKYMVAAVSIRGHYVDLLSAG